MKAQYCSAGSTQTHIFCFINCPLFTLAIHKLLFSENGFRYSLCQFNPSYGFSIYSHFLFNPTHCHFTSHPISGSTSPILLLQMIACGISSSSLPLILSSLFFIVAITSCSLFFLPSPSYYFLHLPPPAAHHFLFAIRKSSVSFLQI